MWHTDEQAFLDLIFAHYDDDVPRLVYADYLDENGHHHRAELVRLQLALARLSDECPERGALAERADRIQTSLAQREVEQHPDWVLAVEFRRGVPDSFVVEAASFLRQGADWVQRVRVRRLRLLDVGDQVRELAGCAHLAVVRELDLCCNDLSGRLATLLQSPHLTNLKLLDLSFTQLGDDDARALAAAASLAGLTTLVLADNPAVTSDALVALAGSRHFSSLRHLDVSGNQIDARGVRALARSDIATQIETVRLSGNPIGSHGTTELVRSPLFGRMLARSARLELSAVGLDTKGLAILAAAPGLRRCTRLDLSNNNLGDNGFAALVRSPFATGLRVVNLARNQISDAGISAVRSQLTPWLGRLQSLDLSGNCLTHRGVRELLSRRGDAAVRLDLSGNLHSGTGMDHDQPTPVGSVVTHVLRDLAETASLRRRVSRPLLQANSSSAPCSSTSVSGADVGRQSERTVRDARNRSVR